MSYQPDTLDGIREFCEAEGQPCGSLDAAEAALNGGLVRQRMPAERTGTTHKFSVGGHEGYITANTYPDGRLGEIFLTGIGQEGSTFRGVMDGFAVMVSVALQYGVPLEQITLKLAGMKFDPEGMTGNPEIPYAKSLLDYIARYLAAQFGDQELADRVDRVSELGGAL